MFTRLTHFIFICYWMATSTFGQSTICNRHSLIKMPLSGEWKELKGNIKSISKKTYHAKEVFGELKKEVFGDSFLTIFNSSRNIKNDSIVEFLSYFSRYKRTVSDIFGIEIFASYNSDPIYEGDLESDKIRNVWIFDANGNNIEFRTYNKNIVVRRMMQTFNRNNSLLEYKEYREDGSLFQTNKFIYDSKGNLTDKYQYGGYIDNYLNISGFEHIKQIYRFDSRIAEKSELDELGNIIWKENYFYNANAYLIKEIKITTETKVKSIRTYKYDINGNLIESIWDGWRHVYLYSSKNIRTDEISYSKEDNEINFRSVYAYDNFGKLITYAYISGYQTINTKYEYDLEGNWIKRSIEAVYKQTDPTEGESNSDKYEVTERIITYK